tara:strand:+ start:1528 stop:1902 length:375 start_codon:yes stop_codon:yes gene_type:complete
MKLKEYTLNENHINDILTNLITQNYLNESRFSKLFSRSKFNIKNWGKIRIKNELRKRNVSTQNIKSGLEEINELEYKKKLNEIFYKKLSSLKSSPKRLIKQKMFQYLNYRGWESALIYEKINEI